MQLKRYSTKELQDLCIDLFYDYMSGVNSDSYECPTPAHCVHKEYESKTKQYQDRINLFKEGLVGELDTSTRQSLSQRLDYLLYGISCIENSNMELQKRIFNEKKSTDFARTLVRIPLDKKINSYYDDFTLEVAFYDDVCTLKGRFETYKTLKTQRERRKFLEDNTEITHMGLLLLKKDFADPTAVILLKGNYNLKDERVKNSVIPLLPIEFSDFNSLSLKDISSIINNDLKQILQSKIDLDKEDLEELSSIIIRGDEYSIYRTRTQSGSYKLPELYIRYICRGTGRVYYNKLNLNNLKLSPKFKEDDYDSYSKAWWNLNTLGEDPDDEKPVIRC